MMSITMEPQERFRKPISKNSDNLSPSIFYNSHLVADQMWKYPRTLLFPFSRQFDSWKYMGTPSDMLTAYAEIATRPSILAVELVGLLLLTWLARKGKLHRRASLGRFLADGKIQL